MRIDHVNLEEDRIKRGLCPHLPDGYLFCHGRHCNTCEIADRIRSRKARECSNYPLFTKENCLKQTALEGGGVFYRKLVLLSEDAMKNYGIIPGFETGTELAPYTVYLHK